MARPQHGGMRDMTVGSPPRQILLFTLPLLAGNFLQQLYNMVDSWVVGNYVSDAALAAVGTGFPVIFFFSSLFMGLSTGGTVVIAQFYGAGQMERVHDAVDTIYAAFLRLIVPMTAAAMLVAKPLLHILRVDEAAMDEALTYLLVVCGGLIGSVGYNFNAGILNGDLVVVRSQPTANQGEIVVAMIDDEATVKRLSRRGGHTWLLPENDEYSPIDGTYAQILGKVAAVVRRY